MQGMVFIVEGMEAVAADMVLGMRQWQRYVNLGVAASQLEAEDGDSGCCSRH